MREGAGALTGTAKVPYGPERWFLVILERRRDESWRAYVPDLPGLFLEAQTEDEVREAIGPAIESFLRGLRIADRPVPEPWSRPLWVSVRGDGL